MLLCTAGVLGSHPLSRDLKILSFSLGLHGKRLIEDTFLELSYGNRYGLIGNRVYFNLTRS